MYWFITFPNEPHHPLHEEMIDFETVINLTSGNIPSQIPQMSRIHKMLKRYSSKRAKQFLARFPSVYWAPDDTDKPPLYFCRCPVNNFSRWKDQIVAWWKTDDLNRCCFSIAMISEIEDFCFLNIGREFRLYFDPDGGFHQNHWPLISLGENTDSNTKNSKVEEGLIEKNRLLRKNLDTKYSWKHDSHPDIINWVKVKMPGFLKSELEIVAISNTYLEIQKRGTVIGIIMIIEYIIFFTQLEETGENERIFVSSPEKIIAAAVQNDIKFIYTNKL